MREGIVDGVYCPLEHGCNVQGGGRGYAGGGELADDVGRLGELDWNLPNRLPK